MVKIIAKAISLANAPMLTEPELLVRARDWSEVLYTVVPVEALSPAVRKAFEDHNSSFPLNAYDLKNAWDSIKATSQALDDSRTLTTDERVAQCTNKANHIEGTFGEVYLYFPGVTEDEVLMPCGLCRKEDYHEAKNQLLAQGKKTA